jgi:hypothetical protein
MNLKKVKSLLDIENLDISIFADSFVPYLYLDGHRTSGVSKDDIGSYKSGFKFFQMFTNILKELGFNQMVTMVHTKRNLAVKGRIESIQASIEQSMKSARNNFQNSNFYLYGNIYEYKKLGFEEFTKFITNISNRLNEEPDFIHHWLINYDENWALDNRKKLSSLPNISTVIRFTKGFVSGGWIPLKMKNATFIYSQIPSSSELWSEEGILVLLLISLKNWITVKDYIGAKSYNKNEKELIHQKRDIDLSFRRIKLNIDAPQPNRIIAFDIEGPIIYEI